MSKYKKESYLNKVFLDREKENITASPRFYLNLTSDVKQVIRLEKVCPEDDRSVLTETLARNLNFIIICIGMNSLILSVLCYGC